MTNVLGLLAAVGGMIGFLLLLWKPRWVVVLVVCMYPLEQLLQSYFPGVFMETSWLLNVAVGGLTGLAVISRLSKGEPVFSGMFNMVAVACVLLYGLAWVGLLWTPSFERATELMNGSLPRAMLFLICAPLLFDDVRDFQRIAVGIMILGSIIAIMIMLNPIASYRGGRLSLELGWQAHKSGRSNPGALANLGGVMTVMAALIRFGRATALLNLIRATSFISGLGLAIVSGSRGQVIFAVVLSVVLYPLARRVASAKQFVINATGFLIVLGGVGLVFLFFIGGENEERWNVDKMFLASGGRLEMVVDLFMQYLSTPSAWLFGLGTNAFTTVSAFGDLPYVHNIIAESICEFGLVGGVLLGMILIGTYRHARDLWHRHAGDPVDRALAAALAGQALFGFIMLLKQSCFYITPGVLLWFLVVARINSHERAVLASTPVVDEPFDEPEELIDDLSEYGEFGDYGEGFALER